MAKKKDSASNNHHRVLATNRRAFYNYEILDRYEGLLVVDENLSSSVSHSFEEGPCLTLKRTPTL